jgi:hypothetical protein
MSDGHNQGAALNIQYPENEASTLVEHVTAC